MDVIWMGVLLGVLVAFARAVLEELGWVDELAWPGMWGRANGVMHPIRFGDLSLLMGFVTLAGSLLLDGLPRPLRVLGVVGFIGGITASLLSETRGGWLAIPFFVAILVYAMSGLNPGMRKPLVVSILVSAGVAAILVMNMGIDKRFMQVSKDLEKYFIQNNSNTSIGARFDMFGAALKQFRGNPVFGVGVGNYHANAQALL